MNTFLDITNFVCPMTFVRAKLHMEGLAAGETAQIRLQGDEPKQNVPRSLQEQGYEIQSLLPENPSDNTEENGEEVYILTVRKPN